MPWRQREGRLPVVIEPLVPADCDLRDFQYMPLDCVRLRDSDLASESTGDEFRAAVMLWCASWHQVPAASLPNSDKTLAKLAGFGHVVKEWLRVKAGAMRNWVMCSDGRWYHPVVAEKAREAWRSKFVQQWKTECGRIRKHASRHKLDLAVPEFDEWMSQGCPMGHALLVPLDTAGRDAPVPQDRPGMSHENPRDNASNRTEQKGTEENVTEGIGLNKAIPPASRPTGKRPLPANFEISDRVRAWAAEKGHGRLPEYFEFFIGYAKRSGKRYADWDEALMGCIREDWAKLRSNGQGATNGMSPYQQMQVEKHQETKRFTESIHGKRSPEPPGREPIDVTPERVD